MHRRETVSATHEMYLKVLYRIQEQDRVIRVRDIARDLGVSPGTVSSVLKTLDRGGLVSHERYGEVSLTPAGHDLAECVVRRFETIQGLLTDVLGVDPETAAEDSCMMEHAVSPATVNRMGNLLRAVRSGGLTMPDLQPVEGRPGTCAACEASGVCQAAEGVKEASA